MLRSTTSAGDAPHSLPQSSSLSKKACRSIRHVRLCPQTSTQRTRERTTQDLHANLGKIYQGVDLCGGRKIDGSKGRLKVGFLSAYFRDHTIGRLNIGRIERLPRADFSVTVLSVGPHGDEMAQRFRRAADRYVVLPRDVAEARRLIADEKLDILLFTDVGMDALTYTLAFSRMAPLQSATWGHPVTTGSPSIDCFLSSKLLETEDADRHYTERLVRLPSLGTYYERPRRSGPHKRRPISDCPRIGTSISAHRHFLSSIPSLTQSSKRSCEVTRGVNWF